MFALFFRGMALYIVMILMMRRPSSKSDRLRQSRFSSRWLITPLEITSAGLPETNARIRSDLSEPIVITPCTMNIAATGRSPCSSGVETLSIGAEMTSASRIVMANS